MESDNSHEDFDHSDGELDDAAHQKLVNNVLNLSYKQHVKKSTRTEPTLQISEFDLGRTSKNVHITDLASALQRGGKQQQIGKQIKRTEQKLTTLPKPLEKPQAERIHRTVAYKRTQNELGRWDPIVSAMRSSTHTTFPLHADSKLEDKVECNADWGYKTELQKELESIEPKDDVQPISDDGKFPMTMEEIMEQRREAARMRVHESYKVAKARRQNKIKSKKYHRLQKKEKMKQQMKEFELLQKSNPEAALQKLEEIEKARAEERMSLRHKSTGQWAKSKLVRAKYDKETRQVLAQQLSLSRDLTQKLKKTGDSDSEPDAGRAEAGEVDNTDNPWLNDNIKVSKEVDDFVSGYRKFWEEQNLKRDEAAKINQESPLCVSDILNGEESADDDVNLEEVDAFTKALEECAKNIAEKQQSGDADSGVSKKYKINEHTKKTQKQIKRKPAKEQNKSDQNDTTAKSAIKKKKRRASARSTCEWVVTDIIHEDNFDLENEFNKIDNQLRRKLADKVKQVKNNSSNKGKASKVMETKNGRKFKSKEPSTELEKLSWQRENPRPIIDEELDETVHRAHSDKDETLDTNELLQLGENEEGKKILNGQNAPEEIDPNKFINMKPTKLNTAIPDLVEFADNDESDQRGVISEAFQGDDVVDEFQKEKQDVIDANNPKSIDLSLPGWGSWGGKDIKVSARKKRRFIVKFPEKMKRKDGNKRHLIINENANKAVRAHLVSDVPFPFKNVKDYEASIRAPIGSTFVPETAFRKLTKPAVTTKMGMIIAPMTEEILIKKKRK